MKFELSVRGLSPRPWGSDEMAWRRAIAKEARCQGAVQQVGRAAQDHHFEVSITFFLDRVNLERTDLDNLAKPVLDTLFTSRNPQVKDPSLTGALFAVDDDRVFQLTLSKKLAAALGEEGIDVTISWSS